MKNYLYSIISCSLLYYLFLWIKSAYSDVVEPKLGEYHLNSQDLELKPMFVVNHGGPINKENFELREFYDKLDSKCETTYKKYDNLLRTVNNYIQRYVNLFLITSGLFNQDGKDANEMITINLEITISSEDLAYLQNFPKMSGDSSVLRDLSKLDAILSKIAKRKERSYLESTMRFSMSLFYYLGFGIHHLLSQCNFYQYSPVLSVLLVTWLIYRFSSRKSFYIYLGIIINSMIIWDSLCLYRIKIKEAEVELQTLKLRKMPPECDPANIRWYHNLVNIFSGDRCLEYYKILNRDPLLEVSLFKCVVDTYSLYTVQSLFRVLGASIRDFTGEISVLWPRPVWWIISVPLVPLIMIIVAFLSLILYGKRLRLSFFGASVEIGDPSAIKETKIINRGGPRLIASYRPLRILGRSRFFKRLEANLTREKESIVTGSKSEPAVCYEKDDAQQSTVSDSEMAKKQD